MASHFQFQVEEIIFFKEIILDGPLGETKYFAIRTEFQERGSPHIYSITWISNAPNIENEAAYIEFIEKTINAQLLDNLNDPELFELVKTYHVHTHSRTCWKCNKNECRFSYGRYLTEKKIIAKPLDSQFNNEENQEILTWRNTLPCQVKSCIDNNLYPAKINVTGPTKDNFTQPPSVKI